MKDTSKYYEVKKSMYPAALKAICQYYEKKEAKKILDTCYIQEFEQDKDLNKKYKVKKAVVLVYPKGGDDWNLDYSITKKAWVYTGGHGTFFGKVKTKKQVLKNNK